MSNSTLSAQNSAGTTETDASITTDDDCGCSPGLACFQCYLEGARGLPAVVPVSRSASTIEWETRA
jgi:hypothetical protein